jgi:hypothetical protein
MKYITDVLSEVVERIRITGNCSIVDNLDGTYTATIDDVSKILLNGYIIFVNSVLFTDEYKVLSKDTNLNTFTFKDIPDKGNSIEVFKTLYPYFSFEKWQGETNLLSLKDNSFIKSKQKYPLVFCLLDVPEYIDNEIFISEVKSLNVYFITQCDPNKSVDARLITSFTNILDPIYRSFIGYLKNHLSIKYLLDYDKKISHQKIYRFFLGTEDKNQNKINDTVDVIQIEITNLKYDLNINNCN